MFENKDFLVPSVHEAKLTLLLDKVGLKVEKIMFFLLPALEL